MKPTSKDMQIDYLQAVVGNTRPNYVPHRIRLDAAVHGDIPGSGTVAPVGEYECHSNQWGAISVKAANGKMLGIKPSERVVLKWRKNEV